MKTTLSLLFIVFALLASCQLREKASGLLLQAEACMELYPDSALTLLRRIDNAEKLTEEDRAYYCLLMTQAMDKNGLSPTSDSLISIAVDYYRTGRDSRQRARSLFYRGRVYYEQGAYEEAALDYKCAENLISQFHDEYLAGLIHSHLGHLNKKNDLYEKALAHYKLALSFYQSGKRIVQITSVLQNIAKSYLHIQRQDSAELYFKQALKDVSQLDVSWQANLYHNVGVFYSNTHRLNLATYYLKRSLALKSTPQEKWQSYAILATVYATKNQLELADSLWREALAIEQVETKVYIYRHLLELSIQNAVLVDIKKYNSAYTQCLDSLNQQNRTREIAEVQANYDQEVLLHRHDVWKLKAICFALIAVVLLVLTIYVYRFYVRYRVCKERELHQKESELQERQQEITHLACKSGTQQSMLGLLHQQLQIAEKQVQEANGRQDLSMSLLLITEPEYPIVIHYFETLQAPLLSFLESHQLSAYETILCLLIANGVSAKQMADILGKTYEAIKKAKQRILVRMKMEKADELSKALQSHLLEPTKP